MQPDTIGEKQTYCGSPDPEALARLFLPVRWNYYYSRSKLGSDPLYAAVAAELRDSPRPLLDIGCGLGLFAFYLRACGHRAPILGVDYDGRKIAGANAAAAKAPRAEGVPAPEFRESDARDGLPDHCGDVAILDILQFMPASGQEALLAEAAARVAPGGALVIRSGLCDGSWRYRITRAADIFAKLTFWMKAAPSEYPTAGSIDAALTKAGLAGGAEPLWGKTPFNNYLLVYRRPA
ncbi:MAG: class I SAM-dependent methyltransferase [Verrucomicrobiales bacterium]